MSDSKPAKIDRKCIDACLRSLNWTALETHLNTLSGDFDPLELLEHIVQCDRMMEKFMSGKLAERRQLRQVFLGELSAYLASGFGQDYSGVGDEIRQLFITIEDGYHKIWAARLTGPAGAMPAENRVGSVFTGAAQVMCRLDAESKAFLDSQKSYGNAHPMTDAQGRALNADANIEAITNAATATLQAEGRANGWVASKSDGFMPGAIVLPVYGPLTKADIDASEACAYNALFWRNWEIIEQRKRFLGGDLQYFEQDADASRAAKQYATQWEYFPSEDVFETADLIANERWKRQFNQTLVEMLAKYGVGDQVVGLGQDVPLAPEALLSEAEVLAISAFCDSLSRDITTETHDYHGLRLIEWIRGYATLRASIGHVFDGADPASLLPARSREDWIKLLQRHGLTKEKANCLIDHLTFTKNSRDLYDSPFVCLSSGDLCLFGPAVRSSEIFTILNSILNKLETDFAEKGFAFETYILNKLNSFDGVEAKTHKTKRGGEDYQYDILMKFDGHIFVIELKNRSLSYGVPQRIYRYIQRTLGDVRQTQRLESALGTYPDILDGLFGPGASDLPRHACLTYATPYSIPKGVDGVHVYDALALIRFFDKQHLTVTSARKLGTDRLLHEHNVANIWERERPTADVLLKQMKNPHQVGLLESLMHTSRVVGEFDKSCAFIRHEQNIKPASGQTTCEYFGVDYDELMARVADFDAEIDLRLKQYPNLRPKS